METVSSNKRIAKNALFLYLRMFLSMAVSLYTVRVVVQTLSVQDYGLYGAIGGVILSFGFVSSVLSNASQRFFSIEIGKGEDGKLHDTFSTLFFTYVGLLFIVVIIAETLGLWFLKTKMEIPAGREVTAVWVYQFALLSFIVTILANPFQSLIIAYERMNLYAYLSILDVVLKLLIVYLLKVFNVDKLKLYALLIFITSVITNSVYVIYCRKKYFVTRLSPKMERSTLNSIFSYSSWTLFGTLAGMCNTQGMNLALNVYFGSIANAAYSISHQVYSTVAMFANNFYVAVKPALMKNYAAGHYGYVLKLFIFSSKALFLLLFMVILPIILCAEEILQLWLGVVEEYMVAFVQLSLIYTLILTMSYPITAIVQAGGNVKLYHSLVDGFSLTSLPIMCMLFHYGFCAEWAYIISIVVFGIAHVLRIYVLKKAFSVFSIKNYISTFIVPASFITITCYCIMTAVKICMPSGFYGVLLTCVVSILLVIALGSFSILSKADRKMIYNLIRNSLN